MSQREGLVVYLNDAEIGGLCRAQAKHWCGTGGTATKIVLSETMQIKALFFPGQLLTNPLWTAKLGGLPPGELGEGQSRSHHWEAETCFNAEAE